MNIMFLDCQTTGMHPSLGSLLEVAWAGPAGARSFLVRLPDGETVPARVSEITGISDELLADAAPPAEVLRTLLEDYSALGPGARVVAHYAQFEKSFLTAAWATAFGEELPFRFLCTFQIAKRLFPEAPSRNIRALVGYLGLDVGEVRRASEHARATREIWDKLAPGLRAFSTVAQLEEWLRTSKAPKPEKIEYRVDRLLRLALPEAPGVYRMVSREGKVLYVGKATSLRARVNSYFRGKKGPGPRKREMLAQTWDIQVTECASALEAALLESEEIKRLDPPYNVSLKTGRRQLRFFSRDFARSGAQQSALLPLGPFARQNAPELLAQWCAAREEPAQVFHDEVPAEDLRAGETLFLARHGWGALPSPRQLLAFGIWRARFLEALPEEEDAGEELAERVSAEEAPLTPEDVADRYEGLALRAAGEYLRAKSLTRLLRCRVHLGSEGRTLEFRIGGEPAAPWAGLGVAEYDRMSVLLTEVRRHGYTVESARGPW